MKSGICPKCESTEVYGDNGWWHNIGVERIALSPMHTILLICVDCGYLEFYIENEKDLEKIKKKFQKIGS